MFAIMMTRHLLKAYQICSELELWFDSARGFLCDALNPVTGYHHVQYTVQICPDIHCLRNESQWVLIMIQVDYIAKLGLSDVLTFMPSSSHWRWPWRSSLACLRIVEWCGMSHSLSSCQSIKKMLWSSVESTTFNNWQVNVSVYSHVVK